MPKKHTRIYLEGGLENIDHTYSENSDGYSQDVNVTNSVEASLVSGENHLGEISPCLTFDSADFVRPADVLAYLAGDVVSDSVESPTTMEFENLARLNGGKGYITKAILSTNQPTNVAEFRLWLYLVNDPTLVGDNVPFPLLWEDKSRRLGYIDFPAMTTEMAGSDSALSIRVGSFPFNTDKSSSLFGVLQTKTGFTPVSEQGFYVKLFAEVG